MIPLHMLVYKNSYSLLPRLVLKEATFDVLSSDEYFDLNNTCNLMTKKKESFEKWNVVQQTFE